MLKVKVLTSSGLMKTEVEEEVAGVEGRPVTLSCVTEPPGEWGVMVVTRVMIL